MPLPPDNERPETLRPVADDVDVNAYVRPMRVPLVVGVAGLVLLGFAGVVVASSRTTQLASVRTVLTEAQVRDATGALAAQPIGGFDPSAAEQALATTLPDAAARCGIAPRPGTHDHFEVTFAPSGWVSTVTLVQPPNSGPNQCVRSKLAMVHVPAFQGDQAKISIPLR
jgi:hypothetical protein